MCANTHKGLYRYTRLLFGVASSPGIFQKSMEHLLHSIPGVVVYISSPMVEEHLSSLEEVQGANLRAKKANF